MKRTLKLYSGDQGGTPGTPDRREKVKNFVVHIDEDDNASTQPQDDVPVYRVRYISRAVLLKSAWQVLAHPPAERQQRLRQRPIRPRTHLS